MIYPIVSRDQIPYETLKQEDVLDDSLKKLERRNQLLKAARQNRLFYSKAKIIFETNEGIKEVQANIWEVTDNNVMLKGGINIPVCCIREVFIEH